MPTRVVREGINYSEVINSLSDRAELFYRRLLHVADDYGRYWNDGNMVLAGTYLLKKGSRWTRKSILRTLKECADKGAVLPYGNGKYICIPKFGQQVRRKSKFPEPPKEFLLIGCTSDAALAATTKVKPRISLGGGGGEAEVEGGGCASEVAAPPPLKPVSESSVPAASPTAPEQPVPLTGPRLGAGFPIAPLDTVKELRDALNTLYKRPPEQGWSYAEECSLLEVVRRGDALGELRLIVQFRRRMPQDERRRFFPQTVESLLQKWTATLDRARLNAPPPAQQQQSSPLVQKPDIKPMTDEQRATMYDRMKSLRKGLTPWSGENPPPGENAS